MIAQEGDERPTTESVLRRFQKLLAEWVEGFGRGAYAELEGRSGVDQGTIQAMATRAPKNRVDLGNLLRIARSAELPLDVMFGLPMDSGKEGAFRAGKAEVLAAVNAALDARDARVAAVRELSAELYGHQLKESRGGDVLPKSDLRPDLARMAEAAGEVKAARKPRARKPRKRGSA